MDLLELKDNITAVASGLNDFGVEPHHTVVAAIGNDTHMFATTLAAAYVGASVCAVPPHLSAESLSKYLRDTKARALIFNTTAQEHSNWKAIYATLPELQSSEFGNPLLSDTYPHLKAVIHTSNEEPSNVASFRSLLVFDPLPSPLPRLARKFDGSAPLLHYYENQKLHTLTQHQLVEQATDFGKKLSLGLDDRIFIASPFSAPQAHAASLAAIIPGASSTINGTSGATAASATQLDALLRDVAAEYTTVLQLTPELLSGILGHARLPSYNLASLKRVVVVPNPGGEKMTLAHETNAKAALGAEILVL